uniref:Cyclin n=1 Tax=Compsopogon caeruleus TaxID=31354 RepID=A0A7S1T5I1_9RHOD|mmetsp:Transcript_11054/g.22027  ORF Transcript_11054/g.22027 Transcript_11054/m.22027 type:complete len:236 (+) Transcript_11054:609-1316(+)|eukprot:CAMPEP_0184682986 /NCGR_PEP_ID=MMETSP0312-20130426/9461_1 /TAXON_ID=31354 /ORGANISM="Compsopogon coeruleus, Strain SAG 36.94" /LENGTH=235 /DNA_ID=CAMNT_0027134999 /DNA_START=570 /DNA_END=1277 /DNA_ORIENTATION=-
MQATTSGPHVSVSPNPEWPNSSPESIRSVDLRGLFVPASGKATWTDLLDENCPRETRHLKLEVIQWESTKPESEEVSSTVRALTKILSTLCTSNEDRIKLENVRDVTRMFFSVRKPGIPLNTYVKRLVKHSRCSRSVFIVALIYLQRLEAAWPTLGATELNIHRLLTTCIMIAAKFVEDVHLNNLHFARAGGVSNVVEMNRLEATALALLKFQTFVSSEEYERYEKLLIRAGLAI